MLNSDFRYYMENFNPILSTERPDQSALKFIAQLPSPIAELIESEGFVRFHAGLFTLCIPEDFKSVIALIFGDDQDFSHKDCYVVGYSAFGVLQCWSDRFANFQISLPEAIIFCRALTISGWSPKATREQLASGLIPDREEADFLDVHGDPMFDRCIEVHGQLHEGQCFGFVPALTIAGVYGPMRTVEHIKRLSALEHFTILAQLERFQLVAVTSNDIMPVRAIG